MIIIYPAIDEVLSEVMDLCSIIVLKFDLLLLNVSDKTLLPTKIIRAVLLLKYRYIQGSQQEHC